jgi:hypothetical protein
MDDMVILDRFGPSSVQSGKVVSVQQNSGGAPVSGCLSPYALMLDAPYETSPSYTATIDTNGPFGPANRPETNCLYYGGIGQQIWPRSPAAILIDDVVVLINTCGTRTYQQGAVGAEQFGSFDPSNGLGLQSDPWDSAQRRLLEWRKLLQKRAGGTSATPSSVDLALSFAAFASLAELTPPTSLTIDEDGEICFYWSAGELTASACVLPDGCLVAYIDPLSNSNVYKADRQFSPAGARDFIDALLSELPD